MKIANIDRQFSYFLNNLRNLNEIFRKDKFSLDDLCKIFM